MHSFKKCKAFILHAYFFPFLSCEDENIIFIPWGFFFFHRCSRSCILTKETGYWGIQTELLRQCGLSLECWSCQKSGWENKNFVKKEKLALSEIHTHTLKTRTFSHPLTSFFPLFFFHASVSRLHQHFLFIWKQGIMQERQHQMIGNLNPPPLTLPSLPPPLSCL